MKKIYLLVALISLLGKASAQTVVFATPGAYSYVVPVGVTSICIDMAGAQGGASLSSSGGLGARIQAILAVTPGHVVDLWVGGQGAGYNYCASTAGGLNGDGYGYGGGGGGGSAVGGTTFPNSPLIAAGGGGGGDNCGITGGEDGGNGGIAVGGTGWECGVTSTCNCGAGGTLTGGGAGATCYISSFGSLGSGGNAASYCYAGGGGGGYYGGGSGAYGGGGGGSSFTSGAGVSGVIGSGGYQSGNGYVIINPACCRSTGAITGTPSVCIGDSTILSDTGALGGAWYSSNTGIATVNPATGVVLGVTAGIVTIIDSVASPCGALSARVTVTVSPPPASYAVTGGGTYCSGGAGVTIGLTGSSAGVSYQAYVGGGPSAGPTAGTGGAITFGPMTVAGTYTIVATNIATGCSAVMTGSAVVAVTPATPTAVSITASPGDTVSPGTTVTFGPIPVNGGSSPSYQWSVNGPTVSSLGTYSYVPANGDIVCIWMTSSAPCPMPALATACDTITVTSTTSVPMAAAGANQLYYPNPTSGILNISLGAHVSETAVVVITNVTGSVVYNTAINLRANQSQSQLDLSALNEGMYFISIRSGDINLTGKLLIAK